MEKIETGSKSVLKDVGLIVETVVENLQVKREVFQKIDSPCDKKTVFATNTSSLPIRAIGEGLSRPLIGIHFFNQTPVLKLVEVISSSDIPCEMVENLMDATRMLEKTPIEVKEAPGFVVNRVLISMINEAISIYAEGVASAEDIDTAMKLGGNHPMGPLELADLIGLDIVFVILDVMLKETGDVKYRPEAMLNRMVREKKLGKKNGKGFYKY